MLTQEVEFKQNEAAGRLVMREGRTRLFKALLFYKKLLVPGLAAKCAGLSSSYITFQLLYYELLYTHLAHFKKL